MQTSRLKTMTLGIGLLTTGWLATTLADQPPARAGEGLPQSAKLVADDGEPDDNFGYALAISGGTLIVGAWQNDSLRANSGAAYVFERMTGAGGWSQVDKLIPDNADFAGDEFGRAVAIDGDRLIVGAQFDDDLETDRGAAYIFERTPNAANPWSQAFKLMTADVSFRQEFGRSVAISGSRAVVGAANNAAYVFERNPGDGTWNQVAELTADDGDANDEFAIAVAMVGATVIVGAYQHNHQGINNNGAAYVFERDPGDGSWSQTAKLTAEDGDELDEFGFSVALAEGRALIGAPGDDDEDNLGGSAYVFDRVAGTDAWTQVDKLTAADPKLGDDFGHSVALYGERALIGAPFDDDRGEESGSAYLFERASAADSWSQMFKLTAADGADQDWFGYSVSLSAEVALAGAHQDDEGENEESGSAYAFALPSDRIFANGFEP